MFDTHPGDPPLFVHLITLCLGLIIAFGLQQIVTLLQRRSRERKARQAAEKSAAPPASNGAG